MTRPPDPRSSGAPRRPCLTLGQVGGASDLQARYVVTTDGRRRGSCAVVGFCNLTTPPASLTPSSPPAPTPALQFYQSCRPSKIRAFSASSAGKRCAIALVSWQNVCGLAFTSRGESRGPPPPCMHTAPSPVDHAARGLAGAAALPPHGALSSIVRRTSTFTYAPSVSCHVVMTPPPPPFPSQPALRGAPG